MAQARLRCSRVLLVPLCDEHAEDGMELDTDPEVMRYLTGRPRSSAEIARSHQALVATAERVSGLGIWAGFVAGEFVGRWTLEPPHRPDQGPVAGQAELGFRVVRRHWRRGLAGEGARRLIQHGFTDLGLRRIFAETMTVNIASRATMAAVGMAYVRTFKLNPTNAFDGAEHGEVEYAITREQWNQQRADDSYYATFEA